MKLTVVTPVFNSERFLEETLASVVEQRDGGVDLEYIVVDGGSTDGSEDILRRYASDISVLISEPDRGPADAINKGLAAATGDVFAWLNADDIYRSGALRRVAAMMEAHPQSALCFGHCPIIDEGGAEIRRPITRFKEMFFRVSSRFTIQCINYISQPAAFFRTEALRKAGPLRLDLKAAWDYDLILRAWRVGPAFHVPNPPLAAFRWHEMSISGTHYRRQFKEEWEVAASDAGRMSLQALLHFGVRIGIVTIYAAMARQRRRRAEKA